MVITSCANIRANVRDEERVSIKTYRMCCVLFLFVFWKKREILCALLCLVARSCPTLCDPMDCSLPVFSVHGFLQARILEWIAISSSRGSSWPRDRTQVSCIAGWFFTVWATEKIQGSALADNPPISQQVSLLCWCAFSLPSHTFLNRTCLLA